jgi:hypothetical protein
MGSTKTTVLEARLVSSSDFESIDVGLLPGNSLLRAGSSAARRQAARFDTSLLWNQLDLLSQQLNGTTTVEAFGVGAVAGFSVLFSAGYVVWCLRGGSLLASALSSIPAWGAFDPLPVLEFWERSPHDEEEEEEAQQIASDEESLQTILT